MPEENGMPTPLELQQILNRLAQLEQENINLAGRLEESRRATRPPTPQPPQLPDNEPRVVLPERFNGDRNKIRTFLNQLELVFLLNPSRYRSDSAKVATAGTLFSGSAAAWFNPLLEHPKLNAQLLSDWTLFREQLRASFGGIDVPAKAANEIRRLKQGNGNVPNYTSQFLQLAADLSWNEEALLDQYRAGLSEEIKDALVHHDRPTTVQALAALATRCDNRLHERKLERSTARPMNPGNSTVLPAQPLPATGYPSSTSAPGPVPMEVDAIRRGPLTDAERDHRKVHNLCIVCASPDHWRKDCPIARTNQRPSNSQPQGNGRRQ